MQKTQYCQEKTQLRWRFTQNIKSGHWSIQFGDQNLPVCESRTNTAESPLIKSQNSLFVAFTTDRSLFRGVLQYVPQKPVFVNTSE